MYRQRGKERLLPYTLGDTTAPGPRAPHSGPAAAATSMDEPPCAEARHLWGALTQKSPAYSLAKHPQSHAKPCKDAGVVLTAFGPPQPPRMSSVCSSITIYETLQTGWIQISWTHSVNYNFTEQKCIVTPRFNTEPCWPATGLLLGVAMAQRWVVWTRTTAPDPEPRLHCSWLAPR